MTSNSDWIDEVLSPQIMNEDTCPECRVNFTELEQTILSKLQEVDRQAKARETELLDALYWMYVQYCNDKWGHQFMGAGETASELLEDAGYIIVDNIGAIVKDNGDSYDQLTTSDKESE